MLSKFQSGFRKVYGAQNCLLLMLEIWKGATDNNKAFGALLTGLSEAFERDIDREKVKNHIFYLLCR